MGETQNLDKFCEKFGHDLPIEEFSSVTINASGCSSGQDEKDIGEPLVPGRVTDRD
jgi:hypothetical protein